jgi:hypothetical protein
MTTALRRLVDEDAVGQLCRRDGRMAALGSDGGSVRLDWVDEVPLLLADPAALEAVEAQARDICRRGIRHVIWAGMGGSVVTVRLLTELGFCAGGQVTVHPLDSTDPAAVNELVRRIGAVRDDVAMVAVSMGITSEEPISHLEWFMGLLTAAGLPAAEHVTVLTVEGSYLGQYASRHGLPVSTVHIGARTGFPGRMSAPATHVFLLPVALHLAAVAAGAGQLRSILRRAWDLHDLAGARDDPAGHPFVQLAAALSDRTVGGRCRLALDLPAPWRPLRIWVEQLLEQSLGKGGQGIVVTDPQPLSRDDGAVTHRMDGDVDLPRLAATFLGWQLCAAMYGYLHGINVVDEPAVETYKALTRVLRDGGDPLGAAAAGRWADRVIGPGDRLDEMAGTLHRRAADVGGYLDVTVNGELPAGAREAVADRLRALGNEVLGVAVKLRRAPAEYHVSEQSEMDGPEFVASIRVVARRYADSQLGPYSDLFLRAQAVATWQAMNDRGRPCYLVVVDEPGGFEALPTFLAELEDGVVKARW